MALVLLLLIPLLGGLLCLAAPKSAARGIAILTLLATLAVLLFATQASLTSALSDPQSAVQNAQSPAWWLEINKSWVPRFGISFHLAMDGLSFLMVALTLVVGIVSLAFLRNEISERHGFYYFNILWTLCGIIGVFLALDLFLFYFFWEVMIIPMYFLLHVWGAERRAYAAIKFFLFTQASGLMMFLAILALYLIHGRATGSYTFDYTQLVGTSMAPQTAMLLMLGFFLAFAVKMPIAPFHSWQPDAYTYTSTGATVILSAIMGKTAAYGLIRFVLPIFPEAVAQFAPTAYILAVFSILYGAVLAFSQRDIKRFVAYTSVSHMGLILLGIFAWNQQSLNGVVLQMISHALSVAGLFLLIGTVQGRLQTRDLAQMGGLWTSAPRMGATALFFALATLGLPGLGNFIAEFLILLGSFQKSVLFASIAMGGVILAAAYSLYLIQRAFQGEKKESLKLADLSAPQFSGLLVLMALLVLFGLYPQPLIQVASASLQSLSAGNVSVPASAVAATGGAVATLLASASGFANSLRSASVAGQPLLPVLPILILVIAASLELLILCFHRSKALSVIVALAGFAAAIASLPFIASSLGLPLQVTSLLIIDQYSLFYMGLIFSTSLVVTILAAVYFRTDTQEREEFYILLLAATIGSAVLTISSNFISFFLGLEILSVSLFGLIAYLHDFKRCVEAGIKFLVIASISSAFLLLGMALVYAQYGQMDFAGLADAVRITPMGILPIIGLALLIIGIGFKLALVPFHMWTPDVYEGAPAPVTAFIATVSKCAVFALVLRFFALFGMELDPRVFTLFAVIAAITMFGGNLLALLQTNVKRILAYSSISHLGYTTVAFLAGGAMASTAVTFYLVVYTITSLVTFGIVTILSREVEEADKLEHYRGLAWKHPFLAAFFAAALLSLAGIPLTAGFIGKFLVVTASGSAALWTLTILLVINSAIGLVYYLRIAGYLYLPLRDEQSKAPALAGPSPLRLSLAASLLLAVLTVIIIWVGVYPAPLMNLIQKMVAGI